MSDHIEQTKAMIAVMQAYVDGKPIEYEYWCKKQKKWEENPQPAWNWPDFEYRIATTPDTIDWSHVAPEWKYMARHSDGSASLFVEEPTLKQNFWASDEEERYASDLLSSYRAGTCDWKESLVRRPE